MPVGAVTEVEELADVPGKIKQISVSLVLPVPGVMDGDVGVVVPVELLEVCVVPSNGVVGLQPDHSLKNHSTTDEPVQPNEPENEPVDVANFHQTTAALKDEPGPTVSARHVLKPAGAVGELGLPVEPFRPSATIIRLPLVTEPVDVTVALVTLLPALLPRFLVPLTSDGLAARGRRRCRHGFHGNGSHTSVLGNFVQNRRGGSTS
jgi:hypothetical protein